MSKITNDGLIRSDTQDTLNKRDRSVCWQLMLLDLLRLSRAVGEASPGKLSGKLYSCTHMKTVGVRQTVKHRTSTIAYIRALSTPTA